MTDIKVIDPMELLDTTGIIGGVVRWNIPKHTRIDQKVFKDQLKMNDFNLRGLITPTEKIVLERAFSSLSKELSNGVVIYVSKKLHETPDYYKMGLIKLIKEEDVKDFSKDNTTSAILDKKTKTITYEGELATRIREEVDKFTDKFTEDDIRLWIKMQIIDASGVMFHGGVYFNPVCELEKIKKIHEFLKQHGLGYLSMIRVFQGMEQALILDCLFDQVKDQIDKIHEEVNKVKKRKGVLGKKRGELEDVNILLNKYQDILEKSEKLDELKRLIKTESDFIFDKVVEMNGGGEEESSSETKEEVPAVTE